MSKSNQLAARVRLLILDVDGVMTDGKLYFSAVGDTMKTFHTQDGQGIKLLRDSGVEVGIITGRQSEIVSRRAAELGLDHVLQGREDKLQALQELLASTDHSLTSTAYVGDDLPDLAAIRAAGFGVAVCNASAIVREQADYVTEAGGGYGAVREVCELIMQAQNTLDAQLAPYLSA
ncbi:MAG: KdsC family phosphatase [Pseudomonadales bacterium]